jgi:uncharacterized membrane protein
MANNNFDVSTNISRFAFVFLIYVLVTTGYVAEVLSCQMRHFLISSSYARHIFAIIMIFAFIMFEGGWDFDHEEQEKFRNDWASGNTVHTMIIALLVYMVFLISSKSKLIPNILFFGLLFILYFVNTYRDYLHKRGRITDETNNSTLVAETVLAIVAIIILIYGFVEYYFYQRDEYAGNFSLKTFLLGVRDCQSIKAVLP